MEPSEIQSALAAAVEEVLEIMCFATVLDSGEGIVPPDADRDRPALSALVRFQGNPPGEFRMIVPWKLARAVGAGFLGREEDEVSDAQAGEVAGELANMICGSALSRLESKATFHLSHPELLSPGEDSSFPGAGRWFDLQDGILAVSLDLQPPV